MNEKALAHWGLLPQKQTNRIVSRVMRIEFVSDRVSYIDLRGHGCNVIVMNVHASSEKKSVDSKDSFYE